MIGKRISGRYEILKYIGGGGMSRVYLSHDVILDRNVAIKILNYDFSNEEELKRRFMREALSATSLTHSHIVDIFDVGEDGDIYYLVMEYIEGQTLKEFIVSNGALTPEQALPIMRQLISAISNAHYNGIVHRDIKPQNILMDHDGNVKITDFGIAMALSATAHTKTNSVLGTVHYLSPEQARGGMATKKSDIYSVGIVFYELLTGKLPFSGESAVSIALKHLQEETPSVRALFPAIPQSVENVILKATTKDASFRYQSADEMQDDLATVLSPERADEPKFATMYEDEMTRAIPAITNQPKFENIEETKKHDPVQIKEGPELPAPVKKRKKWPFVVTGIGILLIGLLFLLPTLFELQKIEVPSVTGLDEAEASDKLAEEGFEVGKRIELTSDEFPAGEIIKTVPEAGKKREKGTEITLYVSTGQEKLEMKDYTGRDFTEVASILEEYKFKSIDPEEKYSDEPVGIILSQNQEAGDEIVPSETDLIFQVSKGKDLRVLEDLAGFNELELTEYARTSGFDIVIVKKVPSSTVRMGHVISQDPRKGAEVEKGGIVEVVLSEGPQEKPVKHIIQTVTIKYIPEEVEVVDEIIPPEDGEELAVEPIEPVNKEQRIRIYVQDRNRTLEKPIDDFMITEDTKKRITIELEEGQRGAYRIMNGDTQVDEKSFNYSDAK